MLSAIIQGLALRNSEKCNAALFSRLYAGFWHFLAINRIFFPHRGKTQKFIRKGLIPIIEITREEAEILRARGAQITVLNPSAPARKKKRITTEDRWVIKALEQLRSANVCYRSGVSK